KWKRHEATLSLCLEPQDRFPPWSLDRRELRTCIDAHGGVVWAGADAGWASRQGTAQVTDDRPFRDQFFRDLLGPAGTARRAGNCVQPEVNEHVIAGAGRSDLHGYNGAACIQPK